MPHVSGRHQALGCADARLQGCRLRDFVKLRVYTLGAGHIGCNWVVQCRRKERVDALRESVSYHVAAAAYVAYVVCERRKVQVTHLAVEGRRQPAASGRCRSRIFILPLRGGSVWLPDMLLVESVCVASNACSWSCVRVIFVDSAADAMASRRAIVVAMCGRKRL
ncbi:hypothetical protein T05_9946 [Trichinella murrelli]|uniref:Uncharacterized protein n=1 Tax=Trichinella murrelli TaxID=144512 RepID=A0A0V0TQA0_9BILA|nr:hypothetical protein T05_9946 [Trichinella murrelli]